MTHGSYVLLAILLLSSCSSIDSGNLKSSAATALAKAKTGAQRGASAVAGAGRSLRDSVGNESADAGSVQLFADIAADQIPHTLMRKPVAEGRLTSDFGRRRNPTSWVGFPKFHSGIDYGAPEGTPVYASGDGVVVQKRVSDSYGNVLKIEHANGFASLYAHLHFFSDGLQEGSKVSRGQQIGAVGSTGRSTAAHLHYELSFNDKRVNPLYTLPDASES